MATLAFDLTAALERFTLHTRLTAAPGTLALVGPSGAGKSTVLRCIAGLARPDAGTVRLDEEVWFDAAARVDVPPEGRSVGMVFQEYALFPHMTVRQNIAFGGRARVDDLLERLRLGALAERRPAALSGGERQRVALARALARDPQVLLLDEPLSALDADTREHVRDELAGVLRDLGLPTVLVTHDIADAAALADRIAVIVDGTIRQTGTLAELTAAPADAHVGRFTGACVVPGRAQPGSDGTTDVLLEGGVRLRSAAALVGDVLVIVAPWALTLTAGDGDGAVAVDDLTPAGGDVRVRMGRLVATVPAAQAAGLAPGARVCVRADPADVHLVPAPGPGAGRDAG